jgi:hypothetical protein
LPLPLLDKDPALPERKIPRSGANVFAFRWEEFLLALLSVAGGCINRGVKVFEREEGFPRVEKPSRPDVVAPNVFVFDHSFVCAIACPENNPRTRRIAEARRRGVLCLDMIPAIFMEETTPHFVPSYRKIYRFLQ